MCSLISGHGQPTGEIHVCAGRLRHCGISTELKFHEFATKPDAVALMPISHDCEDDECVDGSAMH